MGMIHEDFVWMRKYLTPGCSIAEFGNQHVYTDHKPFPEFPATSLNPTCLAGIPAKNAFVEMGYKHSSYDLNGQDGAIVLDLSVHQGFDGTHDVVTDFGTSEHVDNLNAAMRNAFDLCKVGGIILHAVPEVNSWPGHCYWYRTIDFFRTYAQKAKLELIEVDRRPTLGNTTDGWVVFAALRKTAESEFPEDFDSIPVVRKEMGS